MAGFIDNTINSVIGNGSRIYITESSNNKQIIIDIIFLVRSLGLSCYIDKGLYIFGEFLCKIPTIKKIFSPKKNECSMWLYSQIDVIEKGIGTFVGWQLEGNGRFLLSDFTTVHNTPEGQSVGIVLNLSLLTDISCRIPTVYVKDIIERHTSNIIYLNDFEGENNKTKIFLNGNFIGFSDEPDDFVNEIKMFKHTGLLSKQISVVHDNIDEEIRIFSDEGRFIRPLFTLDEENQLKIKIEDGIVWSKLVEQNLIQYLDHTEIEQSVVAMTSEDLLLYPNDYCEIAPATLLGVMAGIIPFSDHSQCIYEEELVYMADGSTKMIRDIQVGDKVITFNPENQRQSIANVSHTYTNFTEKKMYEIRTLSNRKIIACLLYTSPSPRD